MKRTPLLIMMILLIGTLLAGCSEPEKKIELNTTDQKFSYSYGLTLGQNFKLQELNIDSDILTKGIEDALAGVEPMLTAEEVAEVKKTIQDQVMAKADARRAAAAEKNKIEGEEFLAANAQKEGVVTLESGLQYIVIEEGEGPSPKVSDQVTVHYRGTLVNGAEFDSSQKRGQPATFPVGGVIPGWTEALQAMNEGATWQLFVPPALAYGETGAGPVIGPNSTLIFDVKLIKIN